MKNKINGISAFRLSITALSVALFFLNLSFNASANEAKVSSQPKDSEKQTKNESDQQPDTKNDTSLKNIQNSPASSSNSSEPSQSLLRIGPTVSLALPRPINLGVEGRYTPFFGFAANYGFLPTLTISNASVKFNSFDIKARIFPFGKSLFLGAAFGVQNLTGSAIDATTSSTVSLNVKTVFLTPTVGWRWQGSGGFVFGIDFGWQLPLSSSSELTSNASAAAQANASYLSTKSDVEKAGNDIGKTGLPSLTLLHFGWMF
jgi:hypothetical protein